MGKGCRIDFSRLPRNEEEVVENYKIMKYLETLVSEVGGSSGYEKFRQVEEGLPEGHIIDSMIVEKGQWDTEISLFVEKVRSIFKEARFISAVEIEKE